MKSIKDLVKNIKPTGDKIVLIFNCKFEDHEMDEQDKKHCRIMAILQLARDREVLDYIMNYRFNESFRYDKEEKKLYYTIKFIKERRNHRGDA